MAGVGVLPLPTDPHYGCVLLGGLWKVKVPEAVRLWNLAITPTGSLGIAPALFMPRKEWRKHPGWPGGSCLGTAPWAASPFPLPTFPSQLSPLALSYLLGMPQRSCLPELTKAGLSGAEQGRPRGRAWALHHFPSLRK